MRFWECDYCALRIAHDCLPDGWSAVHLRGVVGGESVRFDGSFCGPDCAKRGVGSFIAESAQEAA